MLIRANLIKIILTKRFFEFYLYLTMQVNLVKNTKLHYQYKVFMPEDEFNKNINEEISKITPQIKMDGFRAGKVPPEMIKQKYMSSLVSDVIDKTAKQIISDLKKEHNYEFAAAPQLQLDEESDNRKNVAFFITFEVVPGIPKIKYDKIKVSWPEIKLSEEDLQNQLQKLADKNASVEKIEEDSHEVIMGNIVSIDFKGTVDSIPFEGGSAENYLLEIGRKSFIDNFEEQIVGHKKGDKFTVNVKFPDDYHVESLKAKEAAFEVTINNIYLKKSPLIDDELAKKAGFANLDELKDKITQNMQEMMEYIFKSKVKNRILNYIVDEYDFDLPQTIRGEEISKRKKFLEEDQKIAGDDKEKPEKSLSDKEIIKMAEQQAERSLKIGYLINHLVKENNLKVSEKEFDKEMLLYSNAHGLFNNQQFYDAFQNDPKMKQYMRSLILENKVFDFILEQTSHKKVPLSQKEFESFIDNLDKNPEKF